MATKDERINVRIHPAKKEFCQLAAGKLKMSLTDYAIESIVSRSEQILGAQYLDWAAARADDVDE